MPLSDYAHWNEDAQYMWWHEEGKHVEEPPEQDEVDYGPGDAFADELGEMEDDELREAWGDYAGDRRLQGYVEWELRHRGLVVPT